MKFKKIISAVLAASCVAAVAFSSASAINSTDKLNYSFGKTTAGYAEGTISLTAQSGSYNLYWADNTQALEGYESIATLSFNQSGTQNYVMPSQTAVPDGATKVIAIKNSTEPNKIYFINNIGWGNVYCHAYERANTANRNAAWPGVQMTYVTTNSDGYKVYSIELDPSFDEFQFDNGYGGNKNQTVDIPIGSKNAYIISDPSSSAYYNINNITYGTAGQQVAATVANASAVYTLPSSKITTGKKLYSFANYSDVQLDSTSGSYPYSINNWSNALKFAKSQNTSFIVTAGDNVNNSSSSTQQTEWTLYNKAITDSGYTNPVYEAIGNHELWPGVQTGTAMFVKNSGLDGNQSTIDKGKAYYEVTKNGDHFIFMALEGGFYPDRTEEFSDTQLAWAENLIKKYTGDGHNIFVIEHSPFRSYGAGDNLLTPFYDIPLTDNQASSVKLKNMFKKYKDVVFISGHTHIELKEQYNYSDNGGTSCQMIHDSSVGGSRTIVNSALNYNYTESRTEGYIVDVYEDKLVFKGANLYYGEYLPACTYILRTSADISGVVPTTQPTTAKPTTQPTTAQPTTAPATIMCGDVNGDRVVSIKDASVLQQYLVGSVDLDDNKLKAADADGDGWVTILDASTLQKYLADYFDYLPYSSKNL